MKNFLVVISMFVMSSSVMFAQNYTDTFDANSLGWTESSYESDRGSAVIDKGCMTIKSKGENKSAGALLSALSGVQTKVGENTFFETHCYAPLDVRRPFEVTADVKIDKLADDRLCGFVFNYRDGGTFYSFNFNDQMVNFTRYENNSAVGNITQSVKWTHKRKLNQVWKLSYDGDMLSFYVDDMPILKVKYMPMEYSGFGFYTFGKQTLVIDQMVFTQE